MSLIESNIGYPIIVFYAISAIIIVRFLRKKLKLFFAGLYTVGLLAFNSSLWELPMMLTGPFDMNNFVTGLVYFVPLPLVIVAYNLRIAYAPRTLLLVCVSIIASALYGVFYPASAYAQLGDYYSIGYFTTFIPRTLCLVSLAYLFYPQTSKSKFNIAQNTVV